MACAILLCSVLCTTSVYAASPIPDIHIWTSARSVVHAGKKANDHARKGRWKQALSVAMQSGNQDLQAIFTWRAILSAAEQVPWPQVASFIQQHPNWPQIKRLQSQAERAMPVSLSPEMVVSWFSTSPTQQGRAQFRIPITPEGKRRLAQALISLEKKHALPEPQGYRPFIARLIRESWIKGEWVKRSEQRFLEQHATWLRPEDHAMRVDRLLWNDDLTAARRMLPRLQQGPRALASARIKLRSHRFGLDQAIAAIPEHLQQDEGLLYDRIAWREERRGGKDVLPLLLATPDTSPNAKKWWKKKRRYIAKAFEEQEYYTAYRLARSHGFALTGPGASLVGYAEGQWLAGWIALRFLKDGRAAYQHFYRMFQQVKSPISRGKAAYWTGRAAELNGNQRIAERWYRTAIEYPTSFYGQQAAWRLDIPTLNLPPAPVIQAADEVAYRRSDLVQQGVLLHRIGQPNLAGLFFKEATRQAPSAGLRKLIAELPKALGSPYYGVLVAKTVSRPQGLNPATLLLEARYPLLKELGAPVRNPKADSAFSHAVTLQESQFLPTAQSSAGARGLMQLMPATAKEMAERVGIRYRLARLTSDPAYNVQLGSAYLVHLLKQFSGSRLLTAAAYNAGPSNVRRWIRTYGDPRKMTNTDDILDWMERIPFAETQNYVQRVLEHYTIYRYRLGLVNRVEVMGVQ